MQIIVSNDSKSAIAVAAQKIVDFISIDTWLFISGGSSFAIFKELDGLLSDDQKAVTRLLLVDERYGKEGHENSNWNLFTSIDTSLYGSVYPVLDDSASMQECTHAYNEIVEMALESDAQTVALLGVGTDSHIAGIKPMDQLIFEKVFSNEFVVSYTGPDFERITLTPAAIAQLDFRICFVAGEDKMPVIASLATNRLLHESPVHILKDLQKTVIYNVI